MTLSAVAVDETATAIPRAVKATTIDPRIFHGEGYRKKWARLHVAGVRPSPIYARPIASDPPGERALSDRKMAGALTLINAPSG